MVIAHENIHTMSTNVVHLEKCLPGMRQNPEHNAQHHIHGVWWPALQPQHSGGRNRSMESSRSSLAAE